MEKRMKLSVIVPVYNTAGEGKLEYCLNSLVNQTCRDMEIIAVDDCSTDNSWEIIRRYEAEYPDRFRAVHSPVNRKQGGAKNIGLSMAGGEWIGFIDSDDWITPDMYEVMLARAEETGADMVGCDYCLTHEHSMKVGQVVPNNKPSQAGVLDHALGNTWMLRAKNFAYIPKAMYYYYQHEESTVHTITRKRCEDRMEAGRIMIAEAKKYGYLEEYYKELECSFAVLFYVNTLFTYMFGVKKKELSFVKALGKEMKDTFPGFQENPYYLERFNEEEKKLVRMQQQSSLVFMLYFTLLWTYRNFRKKHK